MQNLLTPEELYNTRSEEVQEILSKPLTFLMRWGIPMLFFIFVGTLVLAHFIRYPDTIAASALLTSNPPPVRLMTKSSGYLKLLVQANETVEAGKPLAYIQNSADLEAVLALERSLERTNDLTKLAPALTKRLGELQPYYDVLQTAQKELKIHAQYPIQAQAQQTIASQIWREKMKAKNIQAQDEIIKNTFAQSYKNYQIDSILYAQKVKTSVEFNQAQGDLLRQKQSLKNSEANMLNQNAQIASMHEKLSEMHLQASEQDAKLLLAVENAFQNLVTQLALWKHRYLLTAPLAGKVHFLKYWADNQYIGAEQEVMSLTQKNSLTQPLSKGEGFKELQIKLKIPAQGAGKVKIGQKVWVELADFPAQEFGKLQAIIKQITPILQTEKGKEDGGQYVVIAELLNTQTDYKKTIEFKPEMQGQAHILTLNYSLLERLLQPLYKVLTTNG
jgi:multidrug efflux pump subunit AcrA (membrane-fusion protein)